MRFSDHTLHDRGRNRPRRRSRPRPRSGSWSFPEFRISKVLYKPDVQLNHTFSCIHRPNSRFSDFERFQSNGEGRRIAPASRIENWNFLLSALLFVSLCHVTLGSETLFEDHFTNKLDKSWSWIRENPQTWRVTSHGLEVRIEPGNMWGGQNNAKNLLTRPLPQPGSTQIEISVRVENKPTHQYEQVDLVWYYDDSHMIKLGQELVDGKLSIVMGREENDKTRTISITPVDSHVVYLRMIARENRVRGQFRTPKTSEWREVGECDMPAPSGNPPRVCLQFYQGPEKEEHWAKVTDFRIAK